jgi:hypothetical protein
MRIIELDAANWRTVLDFYDALLGALEAPEWHGHSIGALIDSMVYGGINEVDPPYSIRVLHFGQLAGDIREEIEVLQRCLAEQTSPDTDSEVRLEIIL